MALLTLKALTARLMHSQMIIQTATLEGLILPGYFQLLKNWAAYKAQQRYQRRHSRHMQERDRRRRARELEDLGQFDDDILSTIWVDSGQHFQCV
jgi:hypothetical protein